MKYGLSRSLSFSSVIDRSSSSLIALRTGSETTAGAVRACVAVRTCVPRLPRPDCPIDINAAEAMNHAEKRAALLDCFNDELFFKPEFMLDFIPNCLPWAEAESAFV